VFSAWQAHAKVRVRDADDAVIVFVELIADEITQEKTLTTFVLSPEND
jgi:hypothetical protein